MKPMARWIVAAACALGVTTFASAQDQQPSAEAKPEEPRESRYFFESALWGAQPIGLQYEPATVVDFSSGEHSILSMRFGTEARGRYRFGYNFGHSIGEVVGTYWSQQDVAELSRFDASNFIYGETKASPSGAGVFDDGLADGFSSVARTKTRDLRIDYYRDAFETPHVKSRWFVGLRRIDHYRVLRATYFALGANLPIVVDPDSGAPRNDLDPDADEATVSSSFSGRGIEAGLDITLPIRRKLWVNTGFALAAVRGRIVSRHSSLTHVYAIIDPETGDATILAPPFDDVFNDPANAKTLAELALPVAFNQNSQVSSSQLLETYVEFRWNCWNRLEVFAGFRGTRYDNVGRDLGLSVDAVPTDRSVGFEGYYAGASYRY
jgi:hypothetical protein